MTSDSLYLKCVKFEKLAYFTLEHQQNKETVTRLNKVVDYIAKNYLSSPQEGQKIFNEIAKLNAGQVDPTASQFKKDLEKFKIHLEFYNERNIPERKQERDLLLKNINTLLEAKNFSQYQQATPSINTAPNDIELDQPIVDKLHPDMGF